MNTDTIEVTVDSLGGLGDGIAQHRGKPVFIAKSCPGDRLEIHIVRENHDGMHGEITRILSPSPQRRIPPCPYFDSCGGCTLQQIDPEHYRKFKTRMLHSALERAGFPLPSAEVIFLPPHSRRRVEFKVAHHAGKTAMAFHALRSHTKVIVDTCTVLRPELEALIAPLGETLGGYIFSPHLYAVSLTAADHGIDMTLTLKDYDIAKLPPLAPLCETLGISRVCVQAHDSNHESKPRIVAQISPVEMQLGAHRVSLPPGAFLQATKEGQNALAQAAIQATKSSRAVVDLFCGIGNYAFPVSDYASVHAVEIDAEMVQSVRDAAARHSIKNVTAERRDLFKNPLSAAELARFDAAIINPPRIGAKAQTQQLAQSNIDNIVMISCNQATFARDAAILKQSGFTLAHAQGIDQFVWSQHLEIVAVFGR